MGIIVIAEAGVNHNGSIELAKQMVIKAKEAGADYIKFQTFIPENLVSKYAQKAQYQKETTGAQESQLEMLEKLALSQKAFIELQEYCKDQEIGFISTPFDMDSIEFLNTLDMDFWKLPSGEITNLPYLVRIAQTGKPIMMSTGMCELEEIREAIHWLKKSGAEEITLLHCNTQYPTPMADVNLKAMETLRKEFQIEVGYSDHTVGIEVPIAAAALGAVVIEKHFTLDKEMEGPDHRASLNPKELQDMILAIRNIEKALGSSKKTPTDSEKSNITVARKSIVAKSNIKKGDVFTEENITVKRPGTGISPMQWYEILGQTAKQSYAEDEVLDVNEMQL